LIEVNLLPGGRKSAGGGSKLSLSLPKFSGGGLPKGDPWVLGAGAIAVIAILGLVWMFMRVSGEVDRLEQAERLAVQDSARLADVIRRTEQLQARRDSIVQRVEVIQEIDGSRYVWPHLMDEVARALPEFTWLTRFIQLSPGELPTFQLEGRAGTIFALTTFMENLEASPFIGGVRLIGSGQGTMDVGGGAQRRVYEWTIEAAAREPPSELIETVPLFGPDVEVMNLRIRDEPGASVDDVRAEED
jgi:Tfp pilus assembly protein PilN